MSNCGLCCSGLCSGVLTITLVKHITNLEYMYHFRMCMDLGKMCVTNAGTHTNQFLLHVGSCRDQCGARLGSPQLLFGCQ